MHLIIVIASLIAFFIVTTVAEHADLNIKSKIFYIVACAIFVLVQGITEIIFLAALKHPTNGISEAVFIFTLMFVELLGTCQLPQVKTSGL